MFCCCTFVGYMQRGGSMRGEELAQQMFATKTAAKKVTWTIMLM